MGNIITIDRHIAESSTTIVLPNANAKVGYIASLEEYHILHRTGFGWH